MKSETFNRRDFLKLAGLTTLGTVSACAPMVDVATPTTMSSAAPEPTLTPAPAVTEQPTAQLAAAPQRKRVLRIAHMTDFHTQPEGNAPDGIRRALHHAQAQEDPADIILNTGDSVFDSLETDKPRTETQWDLFNEILSAENKLPIFHALGNHDVWGWGLSDSKVTADPLYGKEMAVEKLGLENRYYSFDLAGWHFIVLDSTHPRNPVSKYPYIGKLDEEQLQWMMGDVNAVAQTSNMPICIVSHIPILAACEYFDGPNEESGNWVVPASWMHIDARRFRDYFVQIPNIRLCLSGHTHQYETVDYLGVRYMTNGAVCGNWWNGIYMDVPPSYVMVNLYDDGSADSLLVPYDDA